MISPEARLLVATDPGVREHLRRQIDAARRERVKAARSKPKPKQGRPCNAVLGPFSSRPGEKCGRITVPGNIFCGIHGGER